MWKVSALFVKTDLANIFTLLCYSKQRVTYIQNRLISSNTGIGRSMVLSSSQLFLLT
jgi:hypothetical protein